MTNGSLRLLHVLGLQRSGTTLLGALLGATDGVYHCGEIQAWYEPGNSYARAPLCSCGDPECDVWKRLLRSRRQDFHADAGAQMGAQVVVDSSKNLGWALDTHRWAAAHGIPVHCLLIWKRPEASLRSYLKRGFSEAFWKADYLSYHERLISSGMSFSACPYADLMAEPDVMLTAILESLGLPYDPAIKRFWESDAHHLYGSRTIHDQIAAGQGELRVERPAPSAAPIDDAELRQVVARLEEADIRTAPLTPSTVPSSRLSRPAWYWKARARFRFERLRLSIGHFARVGTGRS
jgi:hypothetical protein